MSAIADTVQQIQQNHPVANWFVLLSSVAVGWLAPVASLVAIVWGGLQIYLAVEKRWFNKGNK
jgi:hypothetical protein